MPLTRFETVSAIGQADDTILVSNSIQKLQNLLQLTLYFCTKYNVKLCTEKTKLQAYSNKATHYQAYYQKIVSPVNIDGEAINFVDETEHVGVIRSVEGNLPHIMNRFTAHTRALAAVLPVGLARAHRCNPASSLKVQELYGTPVLLSGVASLVFKKSEIETISLYMKKLAQSTQKLLDGTPACVVAFLGGELPGTAEIHRKQLSTFGMITRMPGSILHIHATQILISAKLSAGSWFQQIRELCIDYNLPHPLDLLSNPLSKYAFNKLVKSKIIDFWEARLRDKAESLTSIQYFKADFMSLTQPHPIWTSCGSNRFECHKAVTAARMLSGKYLTDWLQRHWTDNQEGTCLLPACAQAKAQGTLQHLLLYCPSLDHIRKKLFNLFTRVCMEDPIIFDIVSSAFLTDDTDTKMQLLLDCSTMPAVIQASQQYGTLFRDRILYLGRTWCYNIHRERMTQLGLYNYR